INKKVTIKKTVIHKYADDASNTSWDFGPDIHRSNPLFDRPTTVNAEMQTDGITTTGVGSQTETAIARDLGIQTDEIVASPAAVKTVASPTVSVTQGNWTRGADGKFVQSKVLQSLKNGKYIIDQPF
ncbi:hypothetical protein QEM02_005561, partial [Pseudomonas putida]|nr:hypothetical protein [Pseudomonas putida]